MTFDGWSSLAAVPLLSTFIGMNVKTLRREDLD